MADFASAAMLQVMAAGLRAAGIEPPPLPPLQGARVAFESKRALAEAALRSGGLALLPRLGQGVSALPPGPLHQALLSARGPAELLQRWQRLERYVHSRHRVRCVEAKARSLVLEHRSLRAGAPPTVAEDLIVLGLLVALLERIGAVGVRARCGGARAWPRPDAAGLASAAAAGGTARWTLAWASLQPAPAPKAAAPAAPGRVGEALALVKADLMAPWPVATLAARLGLAPRSWQRELARQGLAHGALLLRARCEAAAEALVGGEEPLAAIGFACGFADQAHFTRRFQGAVGLTPGRYRMAFASG
jgi:AraC-like DNA-binding protein